eukprot:CAMPEP_0198661768 /NCGR_PEP_ID=MMETSP1467-20131203/43853_1 /TAXON_ID=1462469 /ORGANISM="unid. sp., Strain CCMP2135" /LENGTH=333 /DNA_ID=CAMNT_0044398233 /DNA_START=311 /DNA_END=1308 /DNA_ORIENTATION=+
MTRRVSEGMLPERKGRGLCDDDALVGGDEVLDVDEGVLAAVDFEVLESFVDEFAEVLAALLAVVDAVAEVVVLADEDVEDREDLAVVGHEGLADEVLALGDGVADDEDLEDLEDLDDDFLLAGVEGGFDGDDELGNDGQDLLPAAGHHVVDALLGEEGVGLLHFAEAVEEDGQVVVEVQLLDVDLPRDAVRHAAVVDLDGQVPALVEPAELRVGRVRPLRERLEVHDLLLRSLRHRRLLGAQRRHRQRVPQRRLWPDVRAPRPRPLLQEPRRRHAVRPLRHAERRRIARLPRQRLVPARAHIDLRDVRRIETRPSLLEVNVPRTDLEITRRHA